MNIEPLIFTVNIDNYLSRIMNRPDCRGHVMIPEKPEIGGVS